MVTSPGIRNELKMKNLPTRTIYNKIKNVKKKTGNSISDELALGVVGSIEGIDIYKILQKEERFDEIKDIRDILSKFDFSENYVNRKQRQQTQESKTEILPYTIPLSKYNIDYELTKDCKLAPPFRNPVKEALLTLETRMRESLNFQHNLSKLFPCFHASLRCFRFGEREDAIDDGPKRTRIFRREKFQNFH